MALSSRRAPRRCVAAFALAAGSVAPSMAHATRETASERLSLQIVSDAGDETYQVVVRSGEMTAAVCATPCRLQLARGTYSAEAHSGDRTFVVRFTLRSGAPVRVRLGARDSPLQQWTGVALAVAGLSAGAMAVDHWRYLALEGIGLVTRPWVAQYVPSVQGDLALATSVAFVPLAAVLLVPAVRMLSEPHRSAVTERMPAMRTYRNRWSAVRLSSMRFDFVQGGGMLGASVSF